MQTSTSEPWQHIDKYVDTLNPSPFVQSHPPSPLFFFVYNPPEALQVILTTRRGCRMLSAVPEKERTRWTFSKNLLICGLWDGYKHKQLSCEHLRTHLWRLVTKKEWFCQHSFDYGQNGDLLDTNAEGLCSLSLDEHHLHGHASSQQRGDWVKGSCYSLKYGVNRHIPTLKLKHSRTWLGHRISLPS